MKAKKILLFLLFVTAILSCFYLPTLAAGENMVTEENVSILRWTNTSEITCVLSFEGKTATCSARIVGYSGATITSTMTLYKKNGTGWDYVTHWDKDSLTQSVTHSQTYTVDSTGTYKLVISGIVTRNGYDEPVEKSHEAECK